MALSRDRTVALMGLIEVGLFYGVALFLIWGSGIWRPPVLLAAILMIAICVFSNRIHKDSKEKIGLINHYFWPCLKWAFFISSPFAIFLIYLGWGKEMQTGWNVWFGFLGYPFWGFAQEYALLGFVANRLHDGLPVPQHAIPWINGILFSVAHLPNPVLMPVTFASAVLFTYLFFKYRNLYALALVHAIFGILLSLATGDQEGLMSVGKAYTNRVGHWF